MENKTIIYYQARIRFVDVTQTFNLQKAVTLNFTDFDELKDFIKRKVYPLLYGKKRVSLRWRADEPMRAFANRHKDGIEFQEIAEGNYWYINLKWHNGHEHNTFQFGHIQKFEIPLDSTETNFSAKISELM